MNKLNVNEVYMYVVYNESSHQCVLIDFSFSEKEAIAKFSETFQHERFRYVKDECTLYCLGVFNTSTLELRVARLDEVEPTFRGSDVDTVIDCEATTPDA